MPFYENGFFISGKRRDIGNILEHNLGYFYVQDASSMIPPLILDPKKGDIVLDIAASPGSKTTQIAQMMENTGVIIANELSTKRLAPLGQNIQKLGITNTVLISRDGRKLKFNFLFDKILLDAPCSGSGTPKIDFLSPLETWNESTVKGLYKMQISLLFKAFSFLKPGGTLVYSTCSMDIYENEYVIHNFLEKEKDAYLEEARLSGLNHTPAILCYNDKELNPEISKTLRIMPQDNKTEGFFIAKIRKKES
jgi:NOL1/NOP2/sun family putative RNA methylase